MLPSLCVQNRMVLGKLTGNLNPAAAFRLDLGLLPWAATASSNSATLKKYISEQRINIRLCATSLKAKGQSYNSSFQLMAQNYSRKTQFIKFSLRTCY